MRLWSTPAVVLLLLLCLGPANPDRPNGNRNEQERVLGRAEEEVRPFPSRRWTTSRNSPYQKIVSSYEQEVPKEVRDEADQDKADDLKRKPLRTNAPTHDQIASETSAEAAGENLENTDLGADATSTTPAARRRSSSTTQVPSTERSTFNPKKRRRITTTTMTTPQTMPDSLYRYFRPLDRDVPQEVIIPFLDFGKKLSPIVPTPSGVNSIDSKSIVTKLKPVARYDIELRSSDDEMLQEDMDVTVVKKAIERNSVPRGKLRLREQGISDFYRKRAPVQIRTTENLISAAEPSTPSPPPNENDFPVIKKNNGQQIRLPLPLKALEELVSDHYSSAESSHLIKSVEILPEKRRHLLRPIQRLGYIKHSPLTAESSLVKTVMKDVPEVEITTKHEQEDTRSTESISTTTKSTTLQTRTGSFGEQINSPADHKWNSKVLSTAVVTSVSVQESLENPKIQGSTTENPEYKSYDETITPLPLSVLAPNKTNDSLTIVITPLPRRIANTTTPPPLTTWVVSETKITTAKTEIPLRSRDIYKPKTIPPGSSIPHLPRVIPVSLPRLNHTAKTTIKPATPSSSPIETTGVAIVTTPTKHSATVSHPVTTHSPTISSVASSTKPKDITSDDESKTLPTSGPVVTSEKAIPSTTNMIYNEHTTYEETFATTGKTGEAISSMTLENVKVDNRPSDVDTESVPPPIHEDSPEVTTTIPVFYPEDNTTYGNAYHIYFTIPPTSTAPEGETKSDTEAKVVEQKNVTVSTTTYRPGVDLIKLGAVEKEVEVVYPNTMGVTAYVLAVLGLVPVILGALVGARFIMAHNRKKVLDESEYSSEYNRSPLSITSTPLPTKLPRIPTHVSWSETEKSPLASPAVSARWECPREKLRLQTLLGQGNFGQVWKAEADDIAGHEGLTRLVAVKTVKECANNREREDLLRELGIMQELGSHPNVVTLLGCCTEKEPIYVVMEYVMYGKLLSFLRDHRTRAHYYNFSDGTDGLTSRDLTVFAYCVARGMDYLTNKSIIHRDLAARNVLVDHNKLCKIADFGMSRNVRDTGQIYEQRQSKGALPIRWMAPESLHFSLFTHKTDVWSFGILMWEIITLGSTPYATMGAREVMRRVKDGYRLDRPAHCRLELFRVITQCWHSEPSKRPTFSELKAELAQLLSDSEHHGSFVDLDSYADQMRRDSLHRR